MKNNILPITCPAVDDARVNILSIAAAPCPPPPVSRLPREQKSSDASHDYFVSIGGTTYQVSIATVKGARLFRLRHAVRIAV